jgi:predicted transglutaminase-like cysteine proteinase
VLRYVIYMIRTYLLMCAAAITVLCVTGFPTVGLARVSYFVNQETMYSNLGNFPKWKGVLSRYFESSDILNQPCGGTKFNPCKLREWQAFLDGMQGRGLREQVDKVNHYINKNPYILDIDNWGVNDYWATPYEFQKRSGDCEDYAIAKFMSLRALGVPNEQMRVIIVQDLNLGGIIHAVLIVFVEGQVLVLDNQSEQVKNALDIYHYKPIYSINETHWWKHVPIQ